MASVIGQRWEVYRFESVKTVVPRNGEMVCINKPDEFPNAVIPLMGNEEYTIEGLFEQWKRNIGGGTVEQEEAGEYVANYGANVMFDFVVDNKIKVVRFNTPSVTTQTPFGMTFRYPSKVPESDVIAQKFILDCRNANNLVYFQHVCGTYASLENALRIDMTQLPFQISNRYSKINIDGMPFANDRVLKRTRIKQYGVIGGLMLSLSEIVRGDESTPYKIFHPDRNTTHKNPVVVMSNPHIKGNFIAQIGANTRLWVESTDEEWPDAGGEIYRTAGRTHKQKREVVPMFNRSASAIDRVSFARMLATRTGAFENSSQLGIMHKFPNGGLFIEVVLTLYKKRGVVTTDINVFTDMSNGCTGAS